MEGVRDCFGTLGFFGDWDDTLIFLFHSISYRCVVASGVFSGKQHFEA
jgi:hypothetical protein